MYVISDVPTAGSAYIGAPTVRYIPTRRAPWGPAPVPVAASCVELDLEQGLSERAYFGQVACLLYSEQGVEGRKEEGRGENKRRCNVEHIMHVIVSLISK